MALSAYPLVMLSTSWESKMNDSQSRKRRQHFVPQFYLRGFQCDANKVYVLDKSSRKVFKKPIPSFCQKEYLYESDSNDPSWYAGEHVAPGYNEDGLSKLECYYAPTLKKIASFSALEMPFLSIPEEEAKTLSARRKYDCTQSRISISAQRRLDRILASR